MVVETIELNNTKEKVNIKSDGDFELSYDEILEISEEVLKFRDEKELDKGLDIDRYDDKKQLNLARKQGGLYKISPYELEQMSGEYAEINNIVALAKADDGVRNLLLSEIISEFKDDMEIMFNNIDISEEKLDEIIEGVTETINENIEIEGVRHNCDISAYGFVPDNQMEDMKKWIRKKMGF